MCFLDAFSNSFDAIYFSIIPPPSVLISLSPTQLEVPPCYFVSPGSCYHTPRTLTHVWSLYTFPGFVVTPFLYT